MGGEGQGWEGMKKGEVGEVGRDGKGEGWEEWILGWNSWREYERGVGLTKGEREESLRSSESAIPLLLHNGEHLQPALRGEMGEYFATNMSRTSKALRLGTLQTFSDGYNRLGEYSTTLP